MYLILIILLSIQHSTLTETTWNVPEEENIAILTNINFDDFIAAHDNIFVLFYAPWCGFCEMMMDSYSELAKRMKEHNIPVSKIDATVNKAISRKHITTGVPTLKFFIEGHPVDYSGERTVDDMFEFIMKRKGPLVKELKEVIELNELAGSKDGLVMFLPTIDDTMLRVLTVLAKRFNSSNFRYSFKDELKKLYGDTKYVTVAFNSPVGDKEVLATDDKPNAVSLKQFIFMVTSPLINEFVPELTERLLMEHASAMYLITDNLDSPISKEFENFARENYNKIIFITSKINSDSGVKLAELIKVTLFDDPTVIITRFEDFNTVKYNVATHTKEGFAQALIDFNKGTLPLYYNSDKIPEDNNHNVKIVVGKSFEDIVLNNNKYVLLLAYAPWCRHCKKLEPEYDKLGEYFKGIDDVLIAKIDAMANQHEKLHPNGFPTILWYSPDRKDMPIEYMDNRDVKGFVEFIEKNVGKKLINHTGELSEEL